MVDEARGDEIQGELEGLMGDAAPGVPPPERQSRGSEPEDGFESPDASEPEEREAAVERPEPEGPEADPAEEPPSDAADGPAGDPEAPEGGAPLEAMLEKLEERVSLLVDRLAAISEAHRGAVEERGALAARLDRLREEGADPEALNERIRALEADNARLSEHATFLEGRIQRLLTRVRYVVES